MTALDLLAEALAAVGDEFDVFPEETTYGSGPLAEALAATPAGARLLAALEDGLALERLEPGGYIIHRFGDGHRVEYDNFDADADTLPEAVAGIFEMLDDDDDAAALAEAAR